MARKLMSERGYVIVVYGPDSDFPASGETTPVFGGVALPYGAHLRVERRTTAKDFTEQLARWWDAEFAESYPRPNGARYFRCALVEEV